jgi:hypothetical protein
MILSRTSVAQWHVACRMLHMTGGKTTVVPPRSKAWTVRHQSTIQQLSPRSPLMKAALGCCQLAESHSSGAARWSPVRGEGAPPTANNSIRSRLAYASNRYPLLCTHTTFAENEVLDAWASHSALRVAARQECRSGEESTRRTSLLSYALH